MEIDPDRIMPRAEFLQLTRELLRGLSPSAEPEYEATPEANSGRPELALSPDTPADETLAEWLRRKEAAAAQIRELELAIKRGQYVSIEECCRQFAQELGVVRERLLSIAGKISDQLVGRTRDEIFEGINDEICAALKELSEPADLAAHAIEQQRGCEHD